MIVPVLLADSESLFSSVNAELQEVFVTVEVETDAQPVSDVIIIDTNSIGISSLSFCVIFCLIFSVFSFQMPDFSNVKLNPIRMNKCGLIGKFC